MFSVLTSSFVKHSCSPLAWSASWKREFFQSETWIYHNFSMMHFKEFLYYLCLERNSEENISTIAIHSNQSKIISECTLNGLQTPDLTQIIDETRSQEPQQRSQFSNNDVFECMLPQNTTSPFSTKPLLVIFCMFNNCCWISIKSTVIHWHRIFSLLVTPHQMSQIDEKLIQIESNGEPVLKCSTESKQNKWIEQPYICETFNNVSAASDLFYFFAQGKFLPSFFFSQISNTICIVLNSFFVNHFVFPHFQIHQKFSALSMNTYSWQKDVAHQSNA